MERRRGRINVWFGSRGYGFIVSENPFEKFFLHATKVTCGTPAVDAQVDFSILPEKEGKYRTAIDAAVVDVAAPSVEGGAR